MEPLKLAEPQLYLVGRQSIVATGLRDYLHAIGAPSWHTDSEKPAEVLTEVGGRVCYESFHAPRPGGNAAYVSHILESRHGSVTEHGVWNFILTGVSRSLSHELVRYRVGMSPSQRSQRYVDEGDAPFVCPLAIRGDPDTYAIWSEAVNVCRQAYKRLISKLDARIGRQPENQCIGCGGTGFRQPNASDVPCANCRGSGIAPHRRTDVRKAARGAARSVLPNAVTTALKLTFNTRALRHFLEQRCSTAADEEIRRVANLFYGVMIVEAPNLFGDYVRYEMPDGTFALGTRHTRV